MLNNLTNFLNLISTKMMKNVPEADDLIILGTRDKRYGGGYKPTGITASQFKNSIIAVKSVTGLDTDNTDPLNPIIQVSTDGVTITGTGTLADPLVAASSGGTINYSLVAFVDKTIGNDSTAVVGEFNKPFLTIQAAADAAALIATSTDFGIVYVRKGVYSEACLLKPYVTIYNEPGVIYNTNFYVFYDDVNTIQARVLGYARFLGNETCALKIQYNTKLYFEFDEIYGYSAAMQAFIDYKIYIRSLSISYLPTVEIKGNHIEGSSSSGGTITFGGTIDVSMTVSKIIGIGSTIYGKTSAGGSFGGKVVINCPEIINLNQMDIYNNPSRVFLTEGGTVTCDVTINGNIINKSSVITTNGAQIYKNSACVTVMNTQNFTLTVNGNITSTDAATSILQYTGGTQNTGPITINGNVKSSYSNAILLGHGSLIVKGDIIKTAHATYNTSCYPALYIAASNKLYVYGGAIATTATDANAINIGSSACSIFLYNCLILANGTGNCLNGGGTFTPTIGIHGSRTNKALGAALTDSFTPTGLIVDTALTVPTV